MFKDRLEKVIEGIQSKNKDVLKYPLLLDICDPGTSNFVPRKIGDTGYLLMCPINIKSKKSNILLVTGIRQSPTDFMGINPYMMVIMESGSKSYVPGQVVHVSEKLFTKIHGTERMEIDDSVIIVNAAFAYLLPDNVVLGVDGNITEEIKIISIKTLADA